VWDICDDAPNNHEFWGLMRALFGYTCKPTPVEIIAYFLYWALAITFLSFKLHLGWVEKFSWGCCRLLYWGWMVGVVYDKVVLKLPHCG